MRTQTGLGLPRQPQRTLIRIQRIFSVIAIFALSAYLWRNFNGLSWHWKWSGRIALAGGIFASLHFVIALAFYNVHKALGVAETIKAAIGSYVARLPSRYIPGGIWHAVSRYIDIRSSRGLNASQMFGIFLAESFLTGAAGLATAAAMTLMSADGVFEKQMLGILLACGALALVFLFSFVVFVRRIKLVALWPLLMAFVLLSLNWVVVSFAFAQYVLGVDVMPFTACAVKTISTGYLASAVLGYVAVFAPQGWGVTEFIFGLMQTCSAPTVMAVALVTGFRVLGLFADVVLFILWYVYRWLFDFKVRIR